MFPPSRSVVARGATGVQHFKPQTLHEPQLLCPFKIGEAIPQLTKFSRENLSEKPLFGELSWLRGPGPDRMQSTAGSWCWHVVEA